MLKRTIYVCLGLAIGFAVQGCKKGEEDPFMSLRSRKARLTGEWNVTSQEEKYYENGVLLGSQTLSNGIMTDSDGDSRAYSSTVTFEKDNTYEMVTVDDGDTDTDKGNWAFLGKSKEADVKKKEYLYLDNTSYSTTGYSSTYSNFQSGNGMSYQLVKLSNKEIIMHYDVSTSDGTNSDKFEMHITLTKK